MNHQPNSIIYFGIAILVCSSVKPAVDHQCDHWNINLIVTAERNPVVLVSVPCLIETGLCLTQFNAPIDERTQLERSKGP